MGWLIIGLIVLAAILLVAVIVVLVYWAFAHLLMWAWSVALVPLFHLPPLTIWSALGLLVLLSIAGEFLGTSKYIEKAVDGVSGKKAK